MNLWKFILIDRNGVRTEVPEPLNWEDPEIEVARETDNGWHGVFIDYGIGKLKFSDLGAQLLKAEYEQYGANADMRIDILFRCSEDNLYDAFYENGRIAFDQYSDTCGDECVVTVAIEDSSDIMLYKNNYEQTVDINKNIAFDQTTELQQYDWLDWDLEVPSRGLPQTVGGNSPGGEHSIYPITVRLLTPVVGTAVRIRPELTENAKSEIAVSDPAGKYTYAVFPQTTPNLYPTGLTPILQLADGITCYTGTINYKIRLKGTVREEAPTSRDVRILVDVINKAWADIGDPTLHEVEILPDTHYEAVSGPTVPFDLSFEGSCDMEEDDPFLVFLNVVTHYGSTVDQNIYVDWDDETSVTLTAVSNCEPTTAKSYMINEVASRVVEAVTNDRIRFYSETFGRTDSQPYAINYNPCPGLFAISSGLNIRRRLLVNNERPGVFLSPKELFEGLHPLWNIGQTIEPDPNRPGYKRLRYETWRYFYQDEVAIRFLYPTLITRDVDVTRLFNQMNVGFNKWQAEGTTGLYELMTKRQYRVQLNSESNPVDLLTDFICSPYTIELTRRKDETTEDWQYDDDKFGFCLKKSGDSYEVETFLDNVINVSNVIEPNSCYNAIITPARMAMRHFDYVMQGLRTIYADSKLIFAKGEGNYVASFKTTHCNIEGKVMSENEDIDLTDFEDLNDAKPITYAETVTFDHPMNYNTFKRIKDDPTIRYKSFAYTCNGVEYEGWLDVIRYRPMTGTATITLIPKSRSVIVAPPEPECLAEVANLAFEVNGDGYMLITWDASVAGATFWQLIVTMDGQPFQTLNVTETSFQYANLLPGSYNVTIIPFCDVDFPGANYIQGSFDVAAPTFTLTLTAILTTGREPHNKLQLTGVGSFAATSGFSFGFGECCDNTSIPGPATCSSYPGSTFPTPQGLFSFNVGDTAKMVESGADTPGADFGIITKVVLFNLVGITPAQITKAEGQTWDLEFL